MQRLRPDVDIILAILQAVAEAQPHSGFIKSLLQQYQERGGLSKKQLEGLYGKARNVKSIPAGKIATLEAIILKKHSKTRSEAPAPAPLYQKDEATGLLITKILEKYPAHKRVLYFKARYENNEPLGQAELTELQRFSKLLDK